VDGGKERTLSSLEFSRPDASVMNFRLHSALLFGSELQIFSSGKKAAMRSVRHNKRKRHADRGPQKGDEEPNSAERKGRLSSSLSNSTYDAFLPS